MTKKQELLEFIQTINSEEELFCKVIITIEEVEYPIDAYYNLETTDMVEYLDNKFDDNLISIKDDTTEEILSWEKRTKELEEAEELI